MNILINNTSGEPIYKQIYDQIKNQMTSGVLAEDEALPSIRALARSLHISVITTKRAYEELERDGYIYTIVGKGSYAAKRNKELIREEYLCRIERHLEKITELAKSIGLSNKDIIRMLDALGEDNQ